eukprot:TRINITY_DN4411_c0_g1_i1.p1 TRINITY_DN4411_c0_g1~~TRINITY_DN4411_c0_g1_i1.p1  ORF type:complete len:458 (-),score=88.02 TRINITY_DN4411_c0_g1_i1:99-1472(-)
MADSRVRELAVNIISELSTEDLMDILLQLIQVLKYEPYHNSPLARFLVKKAIENRTVAHYFFWCLKSELHIEETQKRFSLLLESYLRGCPYHSDALQKQEMIQSQFIRIANHVKSMIEKSQSHTIFSRKVVDDTLSEMHQRMEMVEFDESLVLGLDPRIEVNGLNVRKCKYMNSAMAPLFLDCVNSDPAASSPIGIFKSGDDLRQDMLTIQMIRLMDKLWKKEGYDFKMNPYGCVSTGDGVGMLEVVQNSATVADITAAGTGITKTTNAWSKTPIKEWLLKHNPGSQFERARNNFSLSCAGYCVATYVMGIGDRHNDNIMIKKDGCLFHIDFGHFLGNFKYKLGVKREAETFVFTKDFQHVIGNSTSQQYLQFVDMIKAAYRIVRMYGNLFMQLFSMMIPCQMPELQSRHDLQFLRKTLALDLSQFEADNHIESLIEKSISSKRQRLNNAIHIWVRK